MAGQITREVHFMESTGEHWLYQRDNLLCYKRKPLGFPVGREIIVCEYPNVFQLNQTPIDLRLLMDVLEFLSRYDLNNNQTITNIDSNLNTIKNDVIDCRSELTNILAYSQEIHTEVQAINTNTNNTASEMQTLNLSNSEIEANTALLKTTPLPVHETTP